MFGRASFLSLTCAASLGIGLAVVPRGAVSARGGQQQPENGGAISGRVIDAVTRAPLARATVTLGGAVVPATAANSPRGIGRGSQLQVETAADGAFEFKGLGRGDVFVRSALAGYTGGFPSQLAPVSGYETLQLQTGQQLTGIVLPMWKGGVVTGHVRAVDGKPLSGRTVQLLRPTSTVDVPYFLPQGSSTTDDLGEYRIGAVPPARYLVALRGSNDSGAAPWHPLLLYPGATSIAGAQLLVVTPSSETAIDFNLPSRLGEYVDVGGRVEGFVDGALMSALQLKLVNSEELATGGIDVPVSTAIVMPQGEFRFRHVPPGQYTIVARALQRRNPAVPTIGPSFLSTLTPIDVGVRPLEDVRVTLTAGAAISGRILFGTTSPHPEFKEFPPNPLYVGGLEAYGDRGIIGPQGTVYPDGRFETMKLPPGRYFLRIRIPQDGDLWWQATSLVVNGQERAHKGIDVGETDVREVVMTLTKPGAGIRGKITDSMGRVRSDVTVFVLRRDWPNIVAERRVSQAGLYSTTGLEPGDYSVSAIVGPGPDWFTPAGRAMLLASARTVTLRADEQRVFDVRVP